MAYPLYLMVRPVPPAESIPTLRACLENAFPHRENLAYLDSLCGSPLPRVTAERLGALSLLPSLLAEAGIPSESLILRRDKNGRPFCVRADGSPADLDFNLSHSSAHVAAALLVGNGRVGVDVEEIVPVPRAETLSRRFCTEGEWALPPPSAEADPSALSEFFTKIWTTREAIAKQAGTGMPLQYDCAKPPQGTRLWQGSLPDTNAAIALCAPSQHAPSAPLLLSDSIHFIMQ